MSFFRNFSIFEDTEFDKRKFFFSLFAVVLSNCYNNVPQRMSFKTIVSFCEKPNIPIYIYFFYLWYTGNILRLYKCMILYSLVNWYDRKNRRSSDLWNKNENRGQTNFYLWFPSPHCDALFFRSYIVYISWNTNGNQRILQVYIFFY